MHKVGLTHLRFLTDDFGIWQHTNGIEIDRTQGYALDDSARALLATLELGEDQLSHIYLGFLEHAITPEKLTNFFDANRQPTDRPWSEDALGEAFWATGSAIRHGFEVERAKVLQERIREHIAHSEHVRTHAYYILGTCITRDPAGKQSVIRLVEQYHAMATPEWPWLEAELSYANTIIPYALIKAGHTFAQPEWIATGLKMLDFLNGACTYEGYPIAIGNKGWFRRGDTKALYDQQPIDIAYQVLANVEAYTATQQPQYQDQATLFFSWFWGNNLLHISMIQEWDESCLDGLHEDGIDINRGSENIVCFLLAQEMVWPYLNTPVEARGR